MTHANPRLSIKGRRRLLERCRTRPPEHVAADTSVPRACLSKWKDRGGTYGETGLQDRTSVPYSSPNQTPPKIVEQI